MYKKILFLITIILFFSIKNVKAESFYEAEYIDGIYMNRYDYRTQTTLYQKARFFRKTGSNDFAYCIEPFRSFEDWSYYEPTFNPTNLSIFQIDRIKKIAHFGYSYKDHYDAKWYAITQLMIWKEAYPSGDYYFTNYLNGPRTNNYEYEINEIEKLISTYDNEPTIKNKKIKIVENSSITLDGGDGLEYYSTDNTEVTLSGREITINSNKEGIYNIQLKRKEENLNKPPIFYQSNNSQNLVDYGDINNKTISFTIEVVKTKIIINKVDSETNTNPQGEAELDGAIYGLFDINENMIKEVEITNSTATIEDIKEGTYYIKEIKPGKGYQLDTEKYEVQISAENPIIELTLSNNVIKKEIHLIKEYENNQLFTREKNISFEIYNNNELIKTITTDENGEIEFYLPYGTYLIKQINTTNGYSIVEPFEIIINNNEIETIELKDYKIPVPNTKTKDNIIIELLLICILKIIF